MCHVCAVGRRPLRRLLPPSRRYSSLPQFIRLLRDARRRYRAAARDVAMPLDGRYARVLICRCCMMLMPLPLCVQECAVQVVCVGGRGAEAVCGYRRGAARGMANVW